jgi:hypothetical protein
MIIRTEPKKFRKEPHSFLTSTKIELKVPQLEARFYPPELLYSPVKKGNRRYVKF